jgi:ABC-type nitrate/sulfonate/bicarbonate transport system substrate-binding protein
MLRYLLLSTVLLVVACTSAAPTSPTAAPPPPTSAGAAKPSEASPGRSVQPSVGASAQPSPSAGASVQPSPSPAAAVAAQPVPTFSGPATRITVSSATGSPNDQPAWVAQETGIFQRNGLNVEVQYLAAAQGIAALLSDQVQISHTGGAETVGALAGGADLVIVANIVPVLPYQFYAGPSIQTMDDLRGKKIGITTAGASYDTALRIVLPKLGLDPDKDVTLIPTGSIPNVTAALFNGAIDGAPLVVSPAAFRTVQGGNFHDVFDFAPNAGPYAGDLVVVKRDYLNQNRAIIQRYVDALVEGIARFKADRATAVQIDKKYLDETDDTLVARTYDYFIQSVTPSQPFPRPEQFPEVVAALAKNNDAVNNIDVTKALDPSLVQSAIDRGLDKNPGV